MVAQDLMALQSINFSAGSGGAVNSTTPSIWPSIGRYYISIW